ncbi:hypothetical protein [Oryzifoliimicrobium ureilyticus]|uniref:hypothetical protein n=1 Tax=Oryzifoliimicrobium ureilyticus TaxID=3113724 RepID=UPI00307660A3
MNSISQAITADIAGGIDRKVAFIDDVFRHAFWPAKEFFYDLLKVPFSRLLTEPPRASVRQQMWKDGLLTPPSVLPLPSHEEHKWIQEYTSLSAESRLALAQYIDPECLYICYEGSPGLLSFLDEIGITYIDIRISPVRFLPDVMIAMRSNSREINAVMSLTSMSKADIESEALLLGASYRHYDRYRTPINAAQTETIYFVGQTATDASIIVGQSYFRIENALSVLREKLSGHDVIYLRHPSADIDHIRREAGILAAVSRSFEISQANSYDILCSDMPATFLGISSGLLQEAAFFGKRSVSLLPPVCPLFLPEEAEDIEPGYYQITFDTFLDERYWNAIFQLMPLGWRDSARTMRPNQLRELHDVWWGYAPHKARPNDFTRAQTRDLRAHVGHLHTMNQFLLSVVSSEASHADDVSDIFGGRSWRWRGGAEVCFQAGGLLIKNRLPAGHWRKLNGRSDALMLVWEETGSVELVEIDAQQVSLKCRSPNGDDFVATSF